MCDGSFLPEPPDSSSNKRMRGFFGDAAFSAEDIVRFKASEVRIARAEYACTCLPEGLGEPLCSGCRKNARIASKGYKVCSCAPGRVCAWHAGASK